MITIEDSQRNHGIGSSKLPLVILILILMSACSASLRSPSDEAFWASLRITGDEAEGYSSLGDMAGRSDVVVVGTFESFRLGRMIQGDAPQDLVGYASTTVQVEEVLSGSLIADPLIVEFVLPTTAADTSAAAIGQQVDDLAADLPKARMVLLLREKRGEGEAGLFRVTNSSGLWVDGDGQLTSPLYEPIDQGIGLYATELNGIESISQLADYLRRP